MFKVPFKISEQVLTLRTIRVVESELKGKAIKGRKRGTYSTNYFLNKLVTFIKLKSLTKSGVIQVYKGEKNTKFIARIAKTIGISPNTLESHLNSLNTANLVQFKKGNSIVLHSWDKLAEYFGVKNTGFHTIKEVSPESILLLADLEKESYCKTAYLKKAETLRTLGVFDRYNVQVSIPKQVEDLQFHLFDLNQKDKNVYLCNPKFSRKIESRRDYFNFQSNQSVYYWLNKMENRGLVQVQKSVRKYSRYCGHFPVDVRGGIYTGFDRSKKMTFITEPLAVIVNQKKFFA